MPIFSEDKINHLSHLVQNVLKAEPKIKAKGSQKEILRSIKKTFTAAVALEEAVRDIVEKKLDSYSRKIVKGSPEWEILYEKTYREETRKRGF